MDRATPSIEVIGVYRLEVTAELVASHAAFDAEDPESRSTARDELESVVGVELWVRNADPSSADGWFRSDDDEQVAWLEALLNDAGDQVLGRSLDPIPEGNPLRVFFYLHYVGDGDLLRSPWHPTVPAVALHPEGSVPVRLTAIHPYAPVD